MDASPTANQPMASQHQTWAGKSFEGLLKALKAMARFAKPLYIIENGVADSEDKLRQKFLKDHITILEKAAEEEKLDVRGYFHWALTDNYEWAKGFKVKFGLYAVNLQTKKRIMQKSAKTYKQIIEHSAG
ncbi:glycoside hydrolase family 1 protein [Candidatus Bathyarchaeota archaeon]|nr:glycoside hydrolase family 1 protein [Candidatus Bathyarchaeota archaeon]